MFSVHGQKNTGRIITAGAVTLVLILLLIYMQGGFTDKVTPGTTPLTREADPPPGLTGAVTDRKSVV